MVADPAGTEPDAPQENQTPREDDAFTGFPDDTSCDACLRRAWLVARLSGHLARTSPRGIDVGALLALSDEDLIAAVGGRRRPGIVAEWEAFDPVPARERSHQLGIDVVCRHDRRFPAALAAVGAPQPLHVAGGLTRLITLTREPAVAIVGARRASSYGLDVAHALGRDLAAAGVTVVSGMALGVDSAAHEGALSRGGRTIAVLAGGADVAYPRSKRGLHRRLIDAACVVSELPPGTIARRWGFPARNRVIAGLAEVTVVVEAGERSGALITSAFARQVGRDVAAVPGRVTSHLASGPNDLIADGAHPVRDARDVLDLVYGVGGGPAVPAPYDGSDLDPEVRLVLQAVADGHDTVPALAKVDGVTAPVTALGELELRGLVRRTVAGTYERIS
jgi:DNA processing protein